MQEFTRKWSMSCACLGAGGLQYALPKYRDEKGVGLYRPTWVRRDERRGEMVLGNDAIGAAGWVGH